MKTYTAMLLIAVISWYNMEVDAFDFSFGGHFNPGIIFDTTPSSQQKYHLRKNKNAIVSNWPRPEHINNYDVSPHSSKPIISGAGFDDNERQHTRNYGSHRRNYRH